MIFIENDVFAFLQTIWQEGMLSVEQETERMYYQDVQKWIDSLTLHQSPIPYQWI